MNFYTTLDRLVSHLPLPIIETRNQLFVEPGAVTSLVINLELEIRLIDEDGRYIDLR